MDAVLVAKRNSESFARPCSTFLKKVLRMAAKNAHIHKVSLAKKINLPSKIAFVTKDTTVLLAWTARYALPITPALTA
jgi:hypothetical protein